jgi:hypothetical protein
LGLSVLRSGWGLLTNDLCFSHLGKANAGQGWVRESRFFGTNARAMT